MAKKTGEVEKSVHVHCFAQIGRLRAKNAACTITLTSNAKTTAGQGRRLSLLSCRLNQRRRLREIPRRIATA